MDIDAKSFFMLVATLAAGGAAGYVASEKHLLPPLLPSNEPPPAPPRPAPPAPSASASASAAPPAASAPPAPTCDDGVGLPGECPPPGYPAVEGGCGSFAATRCAEFKQTMKPKVAENAVACLAKLSPHDRCNAQRVNLCGHNALMTACAEREAAGARDAGDAGAAGASSLASTCQALVASCAGDASVTLSPEDCERTLSGMNAVGRERMAACLRKHCSDRAFLYCESVTKPD